MVRPTCSHSVVDKPIRPKSLKYRPASPILIFQNPKDPTQLNLTALICKSTTTSSASAYASSGTTCLETSVSLTILPQSVMLTKSTRMEDACATSDSSSSEINAMFAHLTNLTISIPSAASVLRATSASMVTVLASMCLLSFLLLPHQSFAALMRSS